MKTLFTATLLVAAIFIAATSTARAAEYQQEILVPILGVTMDEHPSGTVAMVIVRFTNREDSNGLAVQFKSFPGRFSRMAQTATQQAIIRTAKAMGIECDSWTVELAVPYSGVTIYGESLSAMVALEVVAMSRGDFIQPDHVMTGGVTPDGHIAPVGAVPLKVLAAKTSHMRRVLIPDEADPADADWENPFLMQVSPVGTVAQAYKALLDRDTER